LHESFQVIHGAGVMKNVLLAGIGLIVLGMLPAAAADLSVPPARAPIYTKAPPPVWNWTGFYIGGNGGYSFGSANTTVTGLTPLLVPITIGVSPKGWLGGGQAGYNWQSAGSNFVFGLEADFQASGETDTGTCGAPTCVPDADVHNSYRSFGTFRGRIGWDPGHWLFYVTGGFAYANTSLAVNQLGVVSFAQTQWLPGWTVGGGIEYAFDNHWSIKGEYLYLDYGSTSTTIPNTGPLGPAPLGPVLLSTRWTDSVARGGINYRF
jgi:outer membrane immunogenic protein